MGLGDNPIIATAGAGSKVTILNTRLSSAMQNVKKTTYRCRKGCVLSPRGQRESRRREHAPLITHRSRFLYAYILHED